MQLLNMKCFSVIWPRVNFQTQNRSTVLLSVTAVWRHHGERLQESTTSREFQQQISVSQSAAPYDPAGPISERLSNAALSWDETSRMKNIYNVFYRVNYEWKRSLSLFLSKRKYKLLLNLTH